MHFFGFSDVLPSASMTTRMTLMLRMVHILLISLISPWYLSILISIANSCASRNSNINFCHSYSLQQYLVSMPWFSVTLDNNIQQNLNFFNFNSTFWSIFISFFTSFQLVFRMQFPMNYSCNIIVPSFVVLLCQLFTFARNMRCCFIFLVTFYDVVIGMFYLSCFSHSLSKLPALAQHTTYFCFNFQFSFSQTVPAFLRQYLDISLGNCPYILLFFHSSFFPSSNSVWIPSYSLYCYILFFLQLSHFQSMAQLNSWHPHTFLTIY